MASIEAGTFSSISRLLAITSSVACSMATMSSEPKMPASGRMGMPVKPKQSQTGVMCVAMLMKVVLPGAKVDRLMLVEIAQASWKA